MKHNLWTILFLVTAGMFVTQSARAQSGGSYTLTWSSIDGGGATQTSTGGAYSIAGTIGQPDAGHAAGAPYDCLSGFWAGAGSCPADFNGSGTLTVQDIFDFLGAWFAGDARADFNHLTGLSVQDIFDFLAAWFAGC